jgi:hypothetical protein
MSKPDGIAYGMGNCYTELGEHCANAQFITICFLYYWFRTFDLSGSKSCGVST